MSKSEIEPLKVEKPPEAEPLNEDVMKGVLVDALSLMTSEHCDIRCDSHPTEKWKETCSSC